MMSSRRNHPFDEAFGGALKRLSADSKRRKNQTDIPPISVGYKKETILLTPSHPLALRVHKGERISNEDKDGPYVIAPVWNSRLSNFGGHVFLASLEHAELAYGGRWFLKSTPKRLALVRDRSDFESSFKHFIWPNVPTGQNIYSLGHFLDFRVSQLSLKPPYSP